MAEDCPAEVPEQGGVRAGVEEEEPEQGGVRGGVEEEVLEQGGGGEGAKVEAPGSDELLVRIQ